MEQKQENRAAEIPNQPVYQPPKAQICETAGADVVLLSVSREMGSVKESRWRW
ncbi:MAG: hypothetical protein ACI3YK_04030 [Eubacteriales bacterium]